MGDQRQMHDKRNVHPHNKQRRGSFSGKQQNQRVGFDENVVDNELNRAPRRIQRNDDRRGDDRRGDDRRDNRNVDRNVDRNVKIINGENDLKRLKRLADLNKVQLNTFNYNIFYPKRANLTGERETNKFYRSFFSTKKQNDIYVFKIMEFLNIKDETKTCQNIKVIKGNLLNLIKTKTSEKCYSGFNRELVEIGKLIDTLTQNQNLKLVRNFVYIRSTDTTTDKNLDDKNKNKNQETITYSHVLETIMFELLGVTCEQTSGKDPHNFFNFINELKEIMIRMAQKQKFNDNGDTLPIIKQKFSLCYDLIKHLKAAHPQNPSIITINENLTHDPQLFQANKNLPNFDDDAQPDPDDPDSYKKKNFRKLEILTSSITVLSTFPEAVKIIKLINLEFKRVYDNNLITDKNSYKILDDLKFSIVKIFLPYEDEQYLVDTVKTDVLRSLEYYKDKIFTFTKNLDLDLLHEFNNTSTVNIHLTQSEIKDLTDNIKKLFGSTKTQENRKDIVTKAINLLRAQGMNAEDTKKELSNIHFMIANPTKKLSPGDQYMHPNRVDLQTQIPGSRNDALKILNIKFDKNSQLMYVKKQIEYIVKEKIINSIFFQENENELIIWINPYCGIDESKIEHTMLLPRRLYIWILAIVNSGTKILYHSVKIKNGKEIPFTEQINFMKNVCSLHDLKFYQINKNEKFNIINIVDCNKIITIQDLPSAIDDYLLIFPDMRSKFVKTIDISDNDIPTSKNNFSIIFNKNQFTISVQYNEKLFDSYRDFAITAFHIVMSKVGRKFWVKVKYNSNLASINQIVELYSSLFYKKIIKF